MLNLNNKSHWGNTQDIKQWWSNSYKLWEDLPDLRDRSFHLWLHALLQAYGVFDSGWYMSLDGEDTPGLPPQTEVVYRTMFVLGDIDKHYMCHSLEFYKHNNLEVIKFFFDQSPDSGYYWYFVREV